MFLKVNIFGRRNDLSKLYIIWILINERFKCIFSGRIKNEFWMKENLNKGWMYVCIDEEFLERVNG